MRQDPHAVAVPLSRKSFEGGDKLLAVAFALKSPINGEFVKEHFGALIRVRGFDSGDKAGDFDSVVRYQNVVHFRFEEALRGLREYRRIEARRDSYQFRFVSGP